jgi:hypothetical protein
MYTGTGYISGPQAYRPQASGGQAIGVRYATDYGLMRPSQAKSDIILIPGGTCMEFDTFITRASKVCNPGVNNLPREVFTVKASDDFKKGWTLFQSRGESFKEADYAPYEWALIQNMFSVSNTTRHPLSQGAMPIFLN